MWENNDKQSFYYSLVNNTGQIDNDTFSKEITEYASNTKYKTFLEIGTWNGLGSTRAFSNGFKSRNDDYIFYSLECNKEKCEEAVKLYTDNNSGFFTKLTWLFSCLCSTNYFYKYKNESAKSFSGFK